MAENQVIQTVESKGHGGARRGAGRHKLDYDARYFAARGINPIMAGEILARVGNESRIWKRILESEDDRVVLQAMVFLTSMRDGRPSQQLNISSTNISLTADSVAKARAIVAEIRGTPTLGAPSIMLSEAEGGRIDGG